MYQHYHKLSLGIRSIIEYLAQKAARLWKCISWNNVHRTKAWSCSEKDRVSSFQLCSRTHQLLLLNQVFYQLSTTNNNIKLMAAHMKWKIKYWCLLLLTHTKWIHGKGKLNISGMLCNSIYLNTIQKYFFPIGKTINGNILSRDGIHCSLDSFHCFASIEEGADQRCVEQGQLGGEDGGGGGARGGVRGRVAGDTGGCGDQEHKQALQH